MTISERVIRYKSPKGNRPTIRRRTLCDKTGQAVGMLLNIAHGNFYCVKKFLSKTRLPMFVELSRVNHFSVGFGQKAGFHERRAALAAAIARAAGVVDVRADRNARKRRSASSAQIRSISSGSSMSSVESNVAASFPRALAGSFIMADSIVFRFIAKTIIHRQPAVRAGRFRRSSTGTIPHKAIPIVVGSGTASVYPMASSAVSSFTPRVGSAPRVAYASCTCGP